MEKGQLVNVTWGTYKGSKGFITTLNGKNVTVKLSEGFEIALSTDHIELDDNRKDNRMYQTKLNAFNKELGNIKYEVSECKLGYVAYAKSNKTGYAQPSKHRFFLTEDQTIEYVNSLSEPVKRTNKLNIKRLIEQLPSETQLQLSEIDTPIEKLTLPELIKEVKWSIEKMEMDIADDVEDDWELPKQIKQCKSFLKKYDN
jgi:hypothetical protein